MATLRYRTCHLCEATCGLALELDDGGGRVTGVRGDEADVFSRGYLCPKAHALMALHDDPDRLRGPLVRRGGELVPASWPEAFASSPSAARPASRPRSTPRRRWRRWRRAPAPTGCSTP